MSNVSVSKLSDGTNIGYIASQSYFECSTAASTAAKEATSPNNVTFTDTSLLPGVTVHVKFTNTNTASSPTLKIGTSTAKAIYETASSVAGTTPVTSWAAGSVISFTYNGTNWVMNGYVPSVGTVSINSTTLTPDNSGQVDITSQVNALIDAKISGDDATAGDILYGKKAHVNGTQVTGTIATKTSSDLTASGATVTVPAGYYATAASKSVASGSASVPATTIMVTPSMSVNSSGVVTATASGSQSITPSVSAGYVSSGTAGTVSVMGSNTYQLTTKSAQTYTPTTTDQTISSGQYLTGIQTIKGDANLLAGNIKKNVVIFGVPGDLESGGVSRIDTTDSTGGTNVAITGVNEITLQDKTVTPTYATTTITADSGYTGLGSVTLNPYIYNWMGPGAELIQTFPTRSITLADTSFSTWTPTTSAKSILDTSNVGTFTATSMTQYEYFLQWEFEFTAEYVSGATLNNIPSRYVAMYWQALSRRPSNYTNLNLQTYNSQACTTAANYYLLDYYGATAGTHALTYGSAYGIYHSIANATFSSSTATSPTVTVKYPAVYARCNATYMDVEQAPSLATTSPIKMRCKVYRVPLHSMWRTVMEDLVGLYNNPLT